MTSTQPTTPGTGAATGTGLRGRELVKGHGTGNDYLVLVDPGCEVALTASDVAAVCDRHTGVGADGLVRATRTTSLPGGQALLDAVPEAEWFLDAYDAAGAPSQETGNSARLMAAVLDSEGLAGVPDGGSLTLGTRAGARTVTRLGGLWTIDMGPATLGRPEGAVADVDAEGWDSTVTVPGVDGDRAALTVSLGATHTVVALADEAELDAAVLTGPDGPVRVPAPQGPAGLELVVPLGTQADDADATTSVGTARLRVLDPGAGEVLASGSGCCAVAVALHLWERDGDEGASAPATTDYRLLLPAGEVGVHTGPDPLAPGASVLLTGPVALTGKVVVA